MNKIFIVLLFLFSCFSSQSQTIGLLLSTEEASPGYTLFTPTRTAFSYLIDNCGKEVHRWEVESDAGIHAYLLTDGRLLRTERVAGVFNSGGAGGRLMILDWEGTKLWQYDYNSPSFQHHHDVEILPNGNILVIAWELKTAAEAIEAGRDSAFIPGGALWPDHIVELEIMGSNDAEIVWEWHLWDHLVQDFDAAKNNYAVVVDHPELVDINYALQPGTSNPADWNHVNAIDYNEALDQIAISVRTFDEIWIIDHSTTSSEAASHSGGKSGKGGDILYRWGNPAVYQRGTGDQQKLFAQHDVQWIAPGLPDAGKIMIFNNGVDRPNGDFSSIEIVSPPVDANGQYFLEANQAYGPSTTDFTYAADPPASFYAENGSGVQQLPNNNLLICSSPDGRIFEVNPEGEMVWEYINPISFSGPLTQGNLPTQNSLFRANRYSPDYPAFTGRTLVGTEPLELMPLDYNCEIINALEEWVPQEISVGPSPFINQIYIKTDSPIEGEILLLDVLGRVVFRQKGLQQTEVLLLPAIEAGVYFLAIAGNVLKMIKVE